MAWRCLHRQAAGCFPVHLIWDAFASEFWLRQAGTSLPSQSGDALAELPLQQGEQEAQGKSQLPAPLGQHKLCDLQHGDAQHKASLLW